MTKSFLFSLCVIAYFSVLSLCVVLRADHNTLCSLTPFSTGTPADGVPRGPGQTQCHYHPSDCTWPLPIQACLLCSVILPTHPPPPFSFIVHSRSRLSHPHLLTAHLYSHPPTSRPALLQNKPAVLPLHVCPWGCEQVPAGQCGPEPVTHGVSTLLQPAPQT